MSNEINQSSFDSPGEIFNKLHNCVLNYDADGQAELFAEDGVWEFPFAPEGLPHRLIGRERIREVGNAGMHKSKQMGRRITGYSSVKIHESLDPEVIIAEFLLIGEVTATGSTYQIPYIQILRARQGKIILLRDYFPGELIKMALKE